MSTGSCEEHPSLIIWLLDTKREQRVNLCEPLKCPRLSCSIGVYLPGRKPVAHEAGHDHIGHHGYP